MSGAGRWYNFGFISMSQISVRPLRRQLFEGDRVILEVEDTGPGVLPEHEARLFQPFFTTKSVGEGTGLGLSVSRGIIESLGGRFDYRRAAAGGAILLLRSSRHLGVTW